MHFRQGWPALGQGTGFRNQAKFTKLWTGIDIETGSGKWLVGWGSEELKGIVGAL